MLAGIVALLFWAMFYPHFGEIILHNTDIPGYIIFLAIVAIYKIYKFISKKLRNHNIETLEKDEIHKNIDEFVIRKIGFSENLTKYEVKKDEKKFGDFECRLEAGYINNLKFYLDDINVLEADMNNNFTYQIKSGNNLVGTVEVKDRGVILYDLQRVNICTFLVDDSKSEDDWLIFIGKILFLDFTSERLTKYIIKNKNSESIGTFYSALECLELYPDKEIDRGVVLTLAIIILLFKKV